MQLWAYAAKGKWSWNPVTTVRNMSAPSFWEDAKPSKQVNRPAWMTFDDSWVDEVQTGLKACSVFLWFPLYCKPISIPTSVHDAKRMLQG
jgi:POT family proton-dependent oligopeptide transporter